MDVQRDDERTLITKAHRVGPRGTAIHALARCANRILRICRDRPPRPAGAERGQAPIRISKICNFSVMASPRNRS